MAGYGGINGEWLNISKKMAVNPSRKWRRFAIEFLLLAMIG